MGRMRVYGGSWRHRRSQILSQNILSTNHRSRVAQPPPQHRSSHQLFAKHQLRAHLRANWSLTVPREYISNLLLYELNVLIMCFKRVWCRAVKKMRKEMQEEGLQLQLPSNHPLLQMHLASLLLSHPQNSPAVSNYMANISRILCYVDRYLKRQKNPPTIGQTSWGAVSSHLSNISKSEW